MLQGSRIQKISAFISAMVMTAGLCVAAPAINVSAADAYATDKYSEKEVGAEIAKVNGAATGDSFTVVEEAGKKIGKFVVTAEGTAAREAGISNYSPKTGNIVLEQKLKFDLGENSTMESMRCRIKVRGLKNGTENASGFVELADIYPSKICCWSAPNDTMLRLSGSNVFTPGKWYTVKIGIDTANEVFHLYYKQDGAYDWITATPQAGMSLRKSSTKSTVTDANKIDYTKGIQGFYYSMYANKGIGGSISHADFKAYQVPYIAADVTEASVLEDQPTAAPITLNETFENKEAGSLYTVQDAMLWNTKTIGTAEPIYSEIAVDPTNSSNHAQKIVYPEKPYTTANTSVGYFNFAPMQGKVLYKSRFLFTEAMNNKSGSLQLHIGYPVQGSTSAEMTDTRLIYIAANAITMKTPLGTDGGWKGLTFTPGAWYELAVIMDTVHGTYSCYLKQPEGTFEAIGTDLTMPTAPAKKEPNASGKTSNNSLNAVYGNIGESTLNYADNGIGFIGLAAVANGNIETAETEHAIYVDDMSLSQLADDYMTVTRTDGGATVSYRILNAADSRACTMYLIASKTENGVEKVENVTAKPVNLEKFETGAADSLSLTCSADAKVRALLLENGTLRPILSAQSNE